MDLSEELLEEEMDEAEPRSDLVETAVKFLSNPKVGQTPLGERRDFLSKKGLTAEEISLALAKVQNSNASAPLAPAYGPPVPPAMGPQRSWRDAANLLVIVAGTSYAALRLIREFILPRWFGYATPEQQRLEQLEQRVDEVHNSVRFMADSVQQTFSAVQDQKASVDRILANVGGGDTTSAGGSLQELKSEMSIVKSLLLSRSQFPPPLATATTTKLPSWQLSAAKSDADSTPVVEQPDPSKTPNETATP